MQICFCDWLMILKSTSKSTCFAPRTRETETIWWLISLSYGPTDFCTQPEADVPGGPSLCHHSRKLWTKSNRDMPRVKAAWVRETCAFFPSQKGLVFSHSRAIRETRAQILRQSFWVGLSAWRHSNQRRFKIVGRYQRHQLTWKASMDIKTIPHFTLLGGESCIETTDALQQNHHSESCLQLKTIVEPT